MTPTSHQLEPQRLTLSGVRRLSSGVTLDARLIDSMPRAIGWLGGLGVVVSAFIFAAKSAAAAPYLYQPSIQSTLRPSWLTGPLAGLVSAPDNQASAALLNFGLPAMFLFYCLAVLGSGRLRVHHVFGIVALAQVLLILGPSPYPTDQYVYLEFSRMWASLGLNPYVNAVGVAPHAGFLYQWSVWPGARSPYGPLFTVLLGPISTLPFAAAYWCSRLLILAAMLGTVWLCGIGAARVGASRSRTIAFVGLNPLILFYCVAGSHNDVLAVLPVLVAMLLLLKARPLETGSTPRGSSPFHIDLHMTADRLAFAAGLLVAVGAGMKASVLVCAPALVFGTRRRAAALGGLFAGAAIIWLVTVVFFGGQLPALGSQSQFIDQTSFGSLLGNAAGLGGETKAIWAVFEVLFVAAIALSGIVSWRRPAMMADCVTWAAVALVAAISWQEPWYAVLFLVPASCSRSRTLKAACVAITLLLVLAYLPDGQWLTGPASNPLWILHYNDLVVSQS
jgi:hypothetical protein